MSRGKKLQEMEVKTQQSKSAVNANAKPGDPMPKLSTGGTPPTYEDLGGPTPENYKPDDDSAKVKEPGGTLKQVKDVVTKGGRVAEALAIIQATNCSVLAVTSLVDRSTEELDFGVPFQPLVKLDFPTYQPDQLPEELSEIEPTKPGS